ncbi:MAG: transposase [Xenococcaceae cyanobacterium]
MRQSVSFHSLLCPLIFPNALIVIDRFHVMKLLNKALNKIRLELEPTNAWGIITLAINCF